MTQPEEARVRSVYCPSAGGEGRGQPWLCRSRLASLSNPGTVRCAQARGAACHGGAGFTFPAAQDAALRGCLPSLAAGERRNTFFAKGYACKRATGIGLVSFRYLLCSQGVLPTSSGKIVLPTGSLFTLPLSWIPVRDT